MSDKVQLIKEEIERRIKEGSSKNDISEGALALDSLLDFIDSIPEENHFEDKSEMVSEDLEEEIENYIKDSLAIKFPTTDKEQIKADIRYIACHFAEWQKQKDMQLGWHDAKKEQPPMDEEVIVLTNTLNGKELNTPRMICFGHIVNKEYCIDYDGWNIPGVAYWMYYKEPK